VADIPPKRRRRDPNEPPNPRGSKPGQKKRKPNPLPPVKLNKIGRKSVYDPSYPELVERLALLGQTEEETARTLGIDYSTFKVWMDKYPALKTARANGGELADAEIAKALAHRARGYTHKAVKIFLPPGATRAEDAVIVEYDQHYPPSENAANLWLTNRASAKWKNRVDSQSDATVTVKVIGGLPDD